MVSFPSAIFKVGHFFWAKEKGDLQEESPTLVLEKRRELTKCTKHFHM